MPTPNIPCVQPPSSPLIQQPLPQVVITGPKKYDLIYVDCPWHYFGSSTKNAAVGKHYGLMTQQDLGALNVKSILKKKGLVLMWATGPRLDYAIDLIRAWGLHYRGVGFVWVKTRRSDNGIINGQGVPPTFVKPTTEFVLVATTNRSGRPLRLLKSNTPQVVLAPRGRHSEKPEAIRKTIEDTVGPPGGGRDYLEMFARTTTPGWDAIGNQVCGGEDIAISVGKLNGSVACGSNVASPI